MNLAISCCGLSRLPDDGKTVSNVLDARIAQNNIGQVYDKLAGVYNVWGHLTESRARNRAVELARIEDGQNILEAAVETGLTFYEIAKRNPNGMNTGIDLSEGMLRKARKRLQKLSGAKFTLQQVSAFNLPVENHSIDTLVNNYMFDLIANEDMDKLLIEFRRALKKDGKLVLVNMTRGESAASSVYDRIYKISPAAMGGCRGVLLSDKLNDNGFEIVTREYFQQLLFPSEVLLARS
ncbi:MAG: methyltransferase domain-containing protein [Bacteroidota bacterium]